jgi:hypothetical protein
MGSRDRLSGACIRAITAGLLLLTPQPVLGAGPAPETIRAWNDWVAATESRVERELHGAGGFLTSAFVRRPWWEAERLRLFRGEALVGPVAAPDGPGSEVPVPGGWIHHWRGAIFLEGVRLGSLLEWLQHPPRNEPGQEDVLALEVVRRQHDVLTVFIRMRRTEIVTVTYDTWHEVRYERLGTDRAASRSVATRIVELEHAGASSEREKPAGEDHGFMWRLNSYWRYEQVKGGVIAECESLTLSREAPSGVGFLVRPIADGVARQSMERALVYLRRAHAAPPAGG